MRAVLILAAALPGAAGAGTVAPWNADPLDDPCLTIAAPEDVLGRAQWEMWRDGLGCRAAPEGIPAEGAGELAPTLEELLGREALLRFVFDGPPLPPQRRVEGKPHAAPVPAIPLPASGWLLLAGLGVLGALRRRGGGVMSVELSSMSFGQLLALDAVLEAAIAAGARMEAAGRAFEASVDLDKELATVAFSCPCPGSVEVVGWDLAATPMRAAVLALPAPAGREDA